MKRIKFIDISRAFAIIFIVFGHTIVHSLNCGYIFKFLYSFHVVMFFILSGFTFNVKNKRFLEFFKNKFLRIMVPYFIWSILFLAPYFILGKNINSQINSGATFDLSTSLVNVLYGNGANSALKQNSSLWFLPALFSIEIIYFFVIKFIDKHPKHEIFIIFLSLTIGYISSYFLQFFLPWGMNTAFNLGIFFLIGYLLKKYDLLDKTKIFKIRFIIPLSIVGCISFLFNKNVSCIDYDYGVYSLAFLSGLCLSIVFIYISYLIKENKLLEYIGRSTFGILIFHKLIILIFQTKMGKISSLLKESNAFTELILGFIIVLISILLSLIAYEIFKRYFPIGVGEKSYSKKKE